MASLCLQGEHGIMMTTWLNSLGECRQTHWLKNKCFGQAMRNSWVHWPHSRKLDILGGMTFQATILPKTCLLHLSSRITILFMALPQHHSTVLFTVTNLTKLQICWYLGWDHQGFWDWVWAPSPAPYLPYSRRPDRRVYTSKNHNISNSAFNF